LDLSQAQLDAARVQDTDVMLWKDAEPEVPILKQAKAENAELLRFKT
jgi:hypothetical protein